MYLWFPLLGIVAGILAGLLGVGGGLVLVAALAWLLPLFGVPTEAAMHAALASSLASIVLTAASSARAHARRGSVLWPTVAWMVPGLLLGAWLLVMAVELLNSAVEESINIGAPGYDERAKHGKDMASAAVFILLVLNGLLWLCMLVSIT